MAEVKILGFAGSLRAKSFNKMLLREAKNRLPERTELEIFDLEGIPPFNQDSERNPPQVVSAFKDKIEAADAILISTPEYNYSVPGVLKNAIDWASRPYDDNSFEGKPAALMSASTGRIGGARAQYHLRQSFVYLNVYAVNRPEVIVTFAPEKFDDSGNLKDPVTKDLQEELLQNLIRYARVIKGLQSGKWREV